jgi:hypothetical protein
MGCGGGGKLLLLWLDRCSVLGDWRPCSVILSPAHGSCPPGSIDRSIARSRNTHTHASIPPPPPPSPPDQRLNQSINRNQSKQNALQERVRPRRQHLLAGGAPLPGRVRHRGHQGACLYRCGECASCTAPARAGQGNRAVRQGVGPEHSAGAGLFVWGCLGPPKPLITQNTHTHTHTHTYSWARRPWACARRRGSSWRWRSASAPRCSSLRGAYTLLIKLLSAMPWAIFAASSPSPPCLSLVWSYRFHPIAFDLGPMYHVINQSININTQSTHQSLTHTHHIHTCIHAHNQNTKNSVEKIMEVDTHIGAAMSGLMPDARTLVDHARVGFFFRASLPFFLAWLIRIGLFGGRLCCIVSVGGWRCMGWLIGRSVGQSIESIDRLLIGQSIDMTHSPPLRSADSNQRPTD